MNLRRLFSPGGLAKASAQTVGSAGLMLMLNLATGVMTARLLGSQGRGEIAAIVTLGQTLGWAATLGCFQAVVYRNSRLPHESASTIGTWAVLSLPLGIVGVVLGQLLVAPLFAAQSDETVALARLWLLMVPLMPLSEALGAALVADRDFGAMNSYKILQSALPLAAYMVLWAVGMFTVEAVMATHVVVVAVYLVLLVRRVLRRHGISRPRRAIAREGLWYGARAHVGNLGTQLNARLDLLIMPAFLAASAVGLYAVAVSIATMIVTLAGSLAMIALPVAAAGDRHSDRHVARTMHAALLVGAPLAAVVALLAPLLLTLVYSPEFEPAATALQLLVPGAVLLAMSNIAVQGLYGQNRPGTAAATQLPGVVITVVGLLLFLRDGGIEAAALVSTTAYAASFVTGTTLFVGRAGVAWKELIDPRPTIALARRRLGDFAGRRTETVEGAA